MKVNLAKVDNFCDCLPLVSTVTNLINLFQKAVLWCCKVDGPTNSKAPENHYYTHLDHKSVFTCIQLMIPVLGNISVALTKHSQSIQAQSREGLLKLIESDPYYLHTCGSDDFKKNGNFMLEAVKRGAPEVVRWAAPELLEDRDFMLSAVEAKYGVLAWCSPTLLEDPEFACEAERRCGNDDAFGVCMSYPCDVLDKVYANKKFMLHLIKQGHMDFFENSSCDQFASDVDFFVHATSVVEDQQRVSSLIKHFMEGTQAISDNAADVRVEELVTYLTEMENQDKAHQFIAQIMNRKDLYCPLKYNTKFVCLLAENFSESVVRPALQFVSYFHLISKKEEFHKKCEQAYNATLKDRKEALKAATTIKAAFEQNYGKVWKMVAYPEGTKDYEEGKKEYEKQQKDKKDI